MSTDEMLKIVNDYYESCGDASRLKCTFLEEYAMSQGFDVKAYDFRRNADVRLRINDLRNLGVFSAGTGAIAYKNLDVDALINKAQNKKSLRNNLLELDEAWSRIYDRAVLLSEKNTELAECIRQKTLDYENLVCESSGLVTQLAEIKKELKDTMLENRYLRKMLKTYLYPAIANEILKVENILEQVDTEIPQTTIEELADKDVPASLPKSVTTDRQMLSREEILLRRMKKSICGVDSDEW